MGKTLHLIALAGLLGLSTVGSAQRDRPPPPTRPTPPAKPQPPARPEPPTDPDDPTDPECIIKCSNTNSNQICEC